MRVLAIPGLSIPVSELSTDASNGFCSFAVFPDGSKEGWHQSDKADGQREQIARILTEYETILWVEVEYSSLLEGLQRIVRASGDELP